MQYDAHARKPTVLVVDDTSHNLALAAHVLTGQYRVLLANSAARGLELAAGDVRPDLILLDVVMPVMDGYQVCLRLKRDDRTRDIPVIFLTSRVDAQDEQRGLEMGAVDYVTKPINPPLLLARVKAHLTVQANAESRLIQALALDQEIAARKLAAVLATTGDGFWTVSREGNITSVNNAYCRIFGYERHAIVGAHISAFTERAFTKQAIAAHIEQIIDSGGSAQFERSHRHSDGRLIPVEVSVTNLPEFGELAVFLRDISARRRMDEAERVVIAEREVAARKLASIIGTTCDGFWTSDLSGVITSVNDVYCEMVGYGRQEIIGQNIGFFDTAKPTVEKLAAHTERIIACGGYDLFETRQMHRDGHEICLEVSVTYIAQDAVLVAFLRDITVRKNQEDLMRQAALQDVLTELPNRRFLIDAWRRAVSATVRRGGQGAVMLVDLDHFKALNDSKGHDCGDRFLREVADRLRNCVRDEDTVARLGGDEFAVLLADLSADTDVAASQAAMIAERIRASLRDGCWLRDGLYRGSCSIGVTLFCSDRDGLDGLLKFADSAMYQAKQSGGNTIRFFDTAMQERLAKREAQATELRAALAGEQFLLHYQAQVDADRKPLGAEALVRWLHPERGLIPPGHFIPLAEETGLILELGLWVLRTACRQLHAWQQSPATRDLPLSVNVSARQFGQSDFVDIVRGILDETAAPPHLLKLELTESTALRNLEQTIATMQAIKAFGVQFAMDDFGTGHSSLTYLKRLPFDQLKIDQSFVRGLPDDDVGAAIVESIIAMSRALGIEVVAEGIETVPEFRALEARGCFKYQGFLFSRPVPPTDYESFLAVH